MNVRVSPQRTEGEQVLIDLIERSAATLPGEGAIAAMRRAAADALSANGLPTRRVEAWKYTDLRAALREAAPIARPTDAPVPETLGGLATARIIVKDGAFDQSASSLQGLGEAIKVRSLDSVLASTDPIVSKIGQSTEMVGDAAVGLNTALMSGGVVVEIADGAKIEGLVEIAHIRSPGDAAATFTRNLVMVGENASVSLAETFIGDAGAAHQSNTVSELFIGDHSDVHWSRIQSEGPETLHLGTISVRLGSHANLNLLNFAHGSKTARSQIYLNFQGEHANADISGMTILGGSQHADTTMLVEHAVPNCVSSELFKTVADDESRGVFQGKIIVRPHAQKTDGQMSANALLLSESAEFNAKPELEIFADDVVCGHGATCGELDADLLFYLKARGIPPVEAEKLLVTAFLGEAAERIEDEGLVAWLMDRVHDWLEARSSE